MMSTIVARSNNGDDNDGLSPVVIDLLIALLVLLLVSLIIIGALLLLRHRRRNPNEPLLPLHNGHKRLAVTAQHGKQGPIVMVDEKRSLMENDYPNSPKSPVPEIRLTFPEEEDESGKRTSGRMVVVKISEGGSVGLEPYQEEKLPRFGSPGSDRFQSLDLERMGGLKEKEDLYTRS